MADRLDPLEALAAIRVLARVALDAEEPTAELHAKTLTEILRACEAGMPEPREG